MPIFEMRFLLNNREIAIEIAGIYFINRLWERTKTPGVYELFQILSKMTMQMLTQLHRSTPKNGSYKKIELISVKRCFRHKNPGLSNSSSQINFQISNLFSNLNFKFKSQI